MPHTALQSAFDALYPKGQSWYVFVIENGRARERRVDIGHRGAFDVEIVQGLNEGTEVIIHPNNQIVDGAFVTTR
jgi:HlyD family secretion protein